MSVCSGGPRRSLSFDLAERNPKKSRTNDDSDSGEPCSSRSFTQRRGVSRVSQEDKDTVFTWTSTFGFISLGDIRRLRPSFIEYLQYKVVDKEIVYAYRLTLENEYSTEEVRDVLRSLGMTFSFDSEFSGTGMNDDNVLDRRFSEEVSRPPNTRYMIVSAMDNMAAQCNKIATGVRDYVMSLDKSGTAVDDVIFHPTDSTRIGNHVLLGYMNKLVMVLEHPRVHGYIPCETTLSMSAIHRKLKENMFTVGCKVLTSVACGAIHEGYKWFVESFLEKDKAYVACSEKEMHRFVQSMMCQPFTVPEYRYYSYFAFNITYEPGLPMKLTPWGARNGVTEPDWNNIRDPEVVAVNNMTRIVSSGKIPGVTVNQMFEGRDPHGFYSVVIDTDQPYTLDDFQRRWFTFVQSNPKCKIRTNNFLSKDDERFVMDGFNSIEEVSQSVFGWSIVECNASERMGSFRHWKRDIPGVELPALCERKTPAQVADNVTYLSWIMKRDTLAFVGQVDEFTGRSRTLENKIKSLEIQNRTLTRDLQAATMQDLTRGGSYTDEYVQGLETKIGNLEATIRLNTDAHDKKMDELKKAMQETENALNEETAKCNALREDIKKSGDYADSLRVKTRKFLEDFNSIPRPRLSANAHAPVSAPRRNLDLWEVAQELHAAREQERARTEGMEIVWSMFRVV